MNTHQSNINTSHRNSRLWMHRPMLVVICGILLFFGLTAGTDAYAQNSEKILLGGDYSSILDTSLNDSEKKYYINLINVIDHYLKAEIKKEEGKDIKQFFAIKKCLKPCLKSPSTCYNNMEDYYHESIYKYIRSLYILTMPQALRGEIKFDTLGLILFDIASKIFAAGSQTRPGLACFGANPPDNCSVSLEVFRSSPVGREILNSPLDDKSKQRLIGIWFLRQTPYAVESWFDDSSPEDVKPVIKDTIADWTKQFEEKLPVLSSITYDSMPANIDWSKYKTGAPKKSK